MKHFNNNWNHFHISANQRWTFREYRSRFYFERSIQEVMLLVFLLSVCHRARYRHTNERPHTFGTFFISNERRLAEWHHHYIDLDIGSAFQEVPTDDDMFLFTWSTQTRKHEVHQTVATKEETNHLRSSQSSFDWWTSRLTTCSSVRLLLLCWLMTI